MKKKTIFYIIAIIVIFAIVFLGQQAYFQRAGANIISDITSQSGAYLSKGSSWVTENIYPKISGGVQSGGELMQNKAKQIKENILENTTEKIQNYFSGIGDSILGKENNNCLPAQSNQ